VAHAAHVEGDPSFNFHFSLPPRTLSDREYRKWCSRTGHSRRHRGWHTFLLSPHLLLFILDLYLLFHLFLLHLPFFKENGIYIGFVMMTINPTSPAIYGSMNAAYVRRGTILHSIHIIQKVSEVARSHTIEYTEMCVLLYLTTSICRISTLLHTRFSSITLHLNISICRIRTLFHTRFLSTTIHLNISICRICTLLRPRFRWTTC
jgi:uncharacterized membrane protein (DUF441 family)